MNLLKGTAAVALAFVVSGFAFANGRERGEHPHRNSGQSQPQAHPQNLQHSSPRGAWAGNAASHAVNAEQTTSNVRREVPPPAVGSANQRQWPVTQGYDARRMERRGRVDIHFGRMEERIGERDIVQGERLIREGHAIGGVAGQRMIREGDSLALIGGAWEDAGIVEMRRGVRDERRAERIDGGHSWWPSGSKPGESGSSSASDKSEPISRKNEFVWDQHNANAPKTDDRGVICTEQPVKTVPNAEPFLQNANLTRNLENQKSTENGVDQYSWHYQDGYRYAHYLDRWGDHWYGFYHGAEYFWLRQHEGRWWWRDEGLNRWYYWREGRWMYQDPKHPENAYAFNPESRSENSSSGSEGSRGFSGNSSGSNQNSQGSNQNGQGYNSNSQGSDSQGSNSQGSNSQGSNSQGSGHDGGSSGGGQGGQEQ